MKQVIIALYDRGAEYYRPAAAIRTRGEALRGMKNEVNKEGSEINAHPTDYELWQVGEFDDQTGEITPKKELIARAEDLVQGS